MTLKQRAALYHQYSRLIASGLHLDRGTQLMLEQKPVAEVRAYLKGVLKGLADGLGFAEAIAKNNAADVSSLEVSLLRAGERGGRLDSACEHLARYFELRQKSVSKVLGAMIYPLVLLHLGLVFPAIIKAFSGVPYGEVVGQTLLHIGIAWAILAVLYNVWNVIANSVTESPTMNSLVNAIPLVGSINRHWAMARFCQVFQTGLLAGIKMTESLQMAGLASQSALFVEAGKKAGKKITDGSTLTEALKSTKAFAPTFIQTVGTAERTGGLDLEMGRWAVAEAELAAISQDRAAEWLPRIFYVLVMLYVASEIIGIFQGIYGESGMYQQLLNEM